MSEIDGPSNINLKTGEGATRVTRPSTTSDENTPQEQSGDKRANPTDKTRETKEKAGPYDPAVTLSSNLSRLEADTEVAAKYVGVDGQGRPLITTDAGTYVVKYDHTHKKDFDKIPQNSILNIKIIKIERDIEARLTFQELPAQKAPHPPISMPVTLELTGLGSGPAKVSAHAQTNIPIELQTISYDSSNLHRAERIAMESAHKISEMPLPMSTTNYTLYEKSVPLENRAAITQSTIPRNALIAQEQISAPSSSLQATAPPLGTQTVPNTSVKFASDPLTQAAENLLHKNILATVIKTIPKPTIKLPDIVEKHLGSTGPLEVLKAGQSFTLHIDSIAVPAIGPETSALRTSVSETKSPDQHSPQTSTTSKVATKSIQEATAVSNNAPRVTSKAPEGLSGIIIAPGKNIVPDNLQRSAIPPLRNTLYPDRYNTAPRNQPKQNSSFTTLYVATPVSIIKFQSPVDLNPGTVINFSLNEPYQNRENIQHHAEATKTAQTTVELPIRPDQVQSTHPPKSRVTEQSNPVQEAVAEGWIATSFSPLSGGLNTADTLQTAPQPLEHFIQNWQSLSHIISVMPVANGQTIAHSLNNRVPNAQNPTQMASTMIFFMAAMGAKNPAKAWLGPDMTQQLEKQGQGKLLAMLDHDMRRIFRLGAETPVNEWRPSLIPMQVGGEASAVPLLIKQVMEDAQDEGSKSGEDQNDGKIAATRFIVELSLSQFGQVQVDGLLKKTQLNIIIRSKINLPSHMTVKMSNIFTTALEISGYTGDLQFRGQSRDDISAKNVIDKRIHIFKT